MPSRRSSPGRLVLLGLIAVAGIGAAAAAGVVPGMRSGAAAGSARSHLTGRGSVGSGTSQRALLGKAPVHVAASSQRSTPALPAPVEVSIPRLGVVAPVSERVWVQRSGAEAGLLSAPSDYHSLGWYEHGSAGVLVVDGHVGFGSGAGPLAYIGSLRPGDLTTVKFGSGTRSFDIVTVAHVKKGGLPASYFTSAYTGDLMLITCDYQSTFHDGHFADNVYVVARPVARS